MTIEYIEHHAVHEAEIEVRSLLSAAQKHGQRPVLLVASYDDVVRFKQLFAAEGSGFGIGVETFDAWVIDAWDGYGDGRKIISPLERSVLISLVVSEYSAEHADAFRYETPGYVRLLTEVAAEGFAFVSGIESMTSAEMDIVSLLSAYTLQLEHHGLVEVTEVYEFLREQELMAQESVVVFDMETTFAQDLLLDSRDATIVSVPLCASVAQPRSTELEKLQNDLFHPDFDDPIQPEGRVQFAFPSGRYAAPHLLVQRIAAYASEYPRAHIAVAAADPSRMFREIAPRLDGLGVSVAVSDVVPYEATAFGSAWCALVRFVTGPEHPNVAQATDFGLSPFSAMSVRAAQICDSRFRAWRAQTVDEALTDMVGHTDEAYRDMVASVAQGCYGEALDALRRWTGSQQRWPEAFRSQQLAVIARTSEVHSLVESFGGSVQLALSVLESQSIMVSEQRGDVDSASVQVMKLDRLAGCPEAAFDAVLIADLTAAAYPLRDEPGAKDVLFEKLGISKPISSIVRIRKAFSRAVAATTDLLVIERPLKTTDGEDAQAAALFYELVDCYRSDPQNPDEIDDVTGLPPSLRPYVFQRGEEEVAVNLSQTMQPPQLVRTLPVYATGSITEAAKNCIVLPHVSSDGTAMEQTYLSPSDIEAYLECPYRWFACRRLRLESPDADFGPLAFGNFAHGAFEVFHRTLKLQGQRRVTQDNLDDALVLFNEVFDGCLSAEVGRIAKDALDPLSELDRLDIAELKRKMTALVKREANLLPDYVSLEEELVFGADGDVCEYAGVRVKGRADRVDVDAFGHAVVIDYKGSAGREYAFREKGAMEFALPRKMQALIYAQVVRRKMGLLPAGALYLSYGKDQAIRGLYDEIILDPDRDLLGIDPATCATRDIRDVLDRSEEMVARRLDHLFAGDIPAVPYDEKVCEHCPVKVCSGRGAFKGEGA